MNITDKPRISRAIMKRLCALPVLLLWIGCSHANSPATSIASSSAEAKLIVTPIKPLKKDLARFVEQPGQIVPLEQTPVFARVSGYVREVKVDIGDHVTGPKLDSQGKLIQPGQVLFTIDVPELQKELAEKTAAVTQVQAQVKQAEAAVAVAEATRDSARSAITEASAGIERANAEYARWKSELDRFRELAARQAVTAKLVEETQSKLSAADAARKETDARIQSAKSHLKETDAQLEKARADLAATKARVELTQAERDRVATMLGYSVVHAPFDGVVTARHVDTGHLVSANAAATNPLFVIVNAGTVRIVADVPEVDAVYIARGTPAAILISSLGKESISATVTRTTWVLNNATRTLRAEIDLPNPDMKFRPGLYAIARLKVAERKGVLTLPKTALLTAAGQTSCWIVKLDGTLVSTPVVTGLEVAGEVEIVSGLAPDDQVIGTNASAFHAGQQVEIAGPPAKK